MFEILYLALLPLPIFYLIYFRHFFTYYRSEKKSPYYAKHIESFLFGVVLAFGIVLAAPYINEFINTPYSWLDLLIKGVLVEKTGALIVILIIQRNFRSFNILEGVMSAILVGAGFSLVENIIYATSFGKSVIPVRTLFSVPIHITTCGIIGFFASVSTLSATRFYSFLAYARGYVLAIIFHASFDLILLKGGTSSYIIGPLVLTAVAVLELYLARAKNVPARPVLLASNLRFEDWITKYRQPRYERWILNSMGTVNDRRIPFFKARSGIVLWTIAFASIFIGIILIPFAGDIVRFMTLAVSHEEQLLLVSVYPASIGISLIMVGSINPVFFSSSVVRMPVIFDAVISYGDFEETMVSFDITMSNCFLRTFEPLPDSANMKILFESKYFSSKAVEICKVWENHEQKHDEPTGSIIKIKNPPLSFYLFIIRYHLFRIKKGIVFNLRLPGFQSSRMLFMRPSTVMQKEVMYGPGSVVFRQGDTNNTFYYIRKGKVLFYRELESGNRILLETMEAGQIFNEMALLGNTKRNVTAECQTRCVLALARADKLEALIRSDPDFANALVRKLAHRADKVQGTLSQSIDYLQKLQQLAVTRSRVSAAIIGDAYGGYNDQTEIVLPLELDEICKKLNLPADEILRYLNNAFSIKNSELGPVSSKVSEVIEKHYNGIPVQIKKNEG